MIYYLAQSKCYFLTGLVPAQINMKVGLLPSKKVVFICFNKSPLKVIKNAFYFMFKTFFVLVILYFWPDFLVT